MANRTDFNASEHLGYAEGKGAKRVSVFNDGAQINAATYENQIDGNQKTQIVCNNGFNAMVSVFGEQVIGTRVPTESAQFQYGFDTRDATILEENGGDVSAEDSMLVVSSGTANNGHSQITTKKVLRYIPGHEAYAFFTAVFTTAAVDSYQRAGLFGDNNGFYLGYEGTSFGYSRRRGGTDYFTAVNPNDVFNGFDPTKGNVYMIRFGYLGFAPIVFSVQNPSGEWVQIGMIQYPNTATVTHILQTMLNARMEVANTGNTTNLVAKSGSFTFGIIDGGGAIPSDRIFSYNLGAKAITAGSTPLVTFRSKTTFNSIANKVTGRLILLSCATDLSKTSSWVILKGSTVTNTPTWADIDTANSTFEYSTDATINFATGETILAWSMGKTDSFFEKMEEILVDLRPGEYATIGIITTGLGDVNLALRHKELF